MQNLLASPFGGPLHYLQPQALFYVPLDRGKEKVTLMLMREDWVYF